MALGIGSGHHVRVDVQCQAVPRQSERSQARLGIVEYLLHLAVNQRQLAQLRDRCAVDLLDTLMRRVRIHLGQHRVAYHPVQVSPLAHPAGPMVHAPMPHRGHGPVGVLAGLAEPVPTHRIAGAVGLTEDQLQHVQAGLAHRPSRRGELPFVHVVHLNGLAQNGHRLAAGHPVELVVDEQTVVALEACEVVAVGVAVALREGLGGIGRVDHTVGVEVLDVVVLGVDDLARVDAPGEVPIQAVVGRRRLHPGLHEVVTTAQKAQLLFQERGQLTGEAELGGGHAAFGGAAGAGGDGRIGRVGLGLVTQERVQVVEVAGHQQQGVVGRAIVDPGVDAQVATAPKHRLVDLHQTGVVDVFEVEGDGTLPSATSLADDTDVGVDRVVVEILDALLERVDARQHPLDPALGQLGLGPARPLADERVGRVHRAVPHRQVVVGEHLDTRPTQGVSG